MIERIVNYSVSHKLIVLLFTLAIVIFGLYSLTQIPIGAVPDVTNNQVQVITTSRNLSTEDVEKYLTSPVELEMANIPGVVEIRSVSKFGLSVVTVVFEDDMGTYLPRQLLEEKIKSAQENIPEGFGTPFMGPISTGLGEIYQYIVDVEPGYEDRYSITELRTIQDWIIRRQLSGIKGVVEVNTWGGFLKQYEVAVNPARLQSMNISISEIFTALEKNNSVAGGGYIEKTNQSYFIRGEGLVNSLEDIGSIVITNNSGIPVYIKDVAEVKFGHANRFGAITANGEGEKVLGQVMMLKDANSKQTIERVKERVDEIQNTLPEGIIINGFLDRSELISKTTFTISENLILGFLIVFFVVVLLLGNFRSGLVVASVIPLSLLFALALMYIFGVDANLMSLGAIDFGIIIDGAVIIVEFISFNMTANRDKLIGVNKEDKKLLSDKIAYKSTTQMTRSAIFGQLIIIIVFIPILTLSGVEGKMFKPMALVFIFALAGTMIMGFTYVPVISSIFVKPANPTKNNISAKLMAFLMKMYEPSIDWALKYKKVVVGLGAAALIFAFGLFAQMGAEFVPTLDEGDFVIQPVLKTGTSLGKTIKTTTQMEKILKEFPEVKNVVSRIGAAEVPTDPMSMEESDVIITLKPKNEWVSAKTKDELADKFKEALSQIPGLDYEFTQPIEMRFNELITGVRADLAIKVFGDDLDILFQKAKEIEAAIQNVDGASDIIVEKIDGLPQMSVIYDRDKIAKYGLNVGDLNEIIMIGFAGVPAGKVFEGEKQFDLVVRFDKDSFSSLSNLENTPIKLPSGLLLPLSEFAEIKYTESPAKISRDETRRRVVVGVNVRNRDLASVVADVQNIISEKIHLPAGYSITYGGQFENLENAKARLIIAVPIALFLIFVMLHFAFGSFKDAALIYTAIPFAAVGGILLLYLRGMPFSISAGVGFIALFGIAVLNGIVLIEHLKELQKEGVDNIRERILRGTKDRLRPVLLTAGAAALGFLPMAISGSAGAEVQRPLATVVIGGLITSTLLTMIFLPVMYCITDKRFNFKKINLRASLFIVPLLLLLPIDNNAQEKVKELNLDEVIHLAIENNSELKASHLSVKEKESLVGTTLDFDKTNIYYNYDESNIGENNSPLRILGVNQSFKFPTRYFTQNNALETDVDIKKEEYAINLISLKREVSKSYYNVIYLQNLKDKYTYLDSLFNKFLSAANRRYELGETNYLEKLTAESKRNEVNILLYQTEEKIKSEFAVLKSLVQTDSLFTTPNKELPKLKLYDANYEENPGLKYYSKQIDLSDYEVSLQKQDYLPDINLGYFHSFNSGVAPNKYNAFEVGVSLPIWFFPQSARVEALQINKQINTEIYNNYKAKLDAQISVLNTELNMYAKEIDSYEKNGKNLALELLRTSETAFVNGDINFLEYINLIERSVDIVRSYLESLNKYNNTVLSINYLIN